MQMTVNDQLCLGNVGAGSQMELREEPVRRAESVRHTLSESERETRGERNEWLNEREG